MAAGKEAIKRITGFAMDAAWAQRPFWMLNVLRFRDNGGGEAAYAEVVYIYLYIYIFI